jgi:two-component system, OmpR family, heavy metal sensor histidine kinase CusS
MRLRSYRVRLALLAAAPAAVALAAFGAIAWWMTYQTMSARLDSEMRAQLARQIGRSWSHEHWERADAALRTAFADEHTADEQGVVILLVTDVDGSPVYRSSDWPTGLPNDDLPHVTLPSNPRAFGAAERIPGSLEFRGRDERLFPPGARAAPPASLLAIDPPVTMKTVRASDGRKFRFAASANRASSAFLGVDLSTIHARMGVVRNALLLAFPLSLAVTALGAWLVSNRALAPVRRLTLAVRRVTAMGLDQRVRQRDEDVEFAELIQVFNRMLERLQLSFQQASRFSSDAAHELKTPLAVLQGEIERTMAAAEPGSPLQRQQATLLDEVRRLHGIVEKLLLLSRADAGRLQIAREAFDLNAAISDIVEDVQLAAPGMKVDVKLPAAAQVVADPDLLTQALQNVMSNAVKYNSDPQRGWIQIRVAHMQSNLRIEVANSSKGIASDHRERIFERFFRADTARGRKIDGLGLGLPLAREIARAHGGDLVLANNVPGQVSFLLTLRA